MPQFLEIAPHEPSRIKNIKTFLNKCQTCRYDQLVQQFENEDYVAIIQQKLADLPVDVSKHSFEAVISEIRKYDDLLCYIRNAYNAIKPQPLVIGLDTLVTRIAEVLDINTRQSSPHLRFNIDSDFWVGTKYYNFGNYKINIYAHAFADVNNIPFVIIPPISVLHCVDGYLHPNIFIDMQRNAWLPKVLDYFNKCQYYNVVNAFRELLQVRRESDGMEQWAKFCKKDLTVNV